jgi:ribose transport system ATP-binding protein
VVDATLAAAGEEKAGDRNRPAALVIAGVSKTFVGARALDKVSMSVAAGEIHALLGENGAGKSTLMKILCGVYRPDCGTITLNGNDRQFANHKEAVQAGIGIAFQEFTLTKALALDARVLILDEPTATLTPTEVEHLFAVMRELRRDGVAIIFISHHMDEIFEICDRVTVLRDGTLAGSAAIAETNLDALIEMMVGRRIKHSYPDKGGVDSASAIALEVTDLQIDRGGPINAFAVRCGEILGFAGLVGSGRTETALAVFGAKRAHRRTVRVHGKFVSLPDPAAALAHGIGLLPESRKSEGLITAFSVQDNITLNNLAKYSAAGPLLSNSAQRAAAERLIEQLRIKAAGPRVAVETLSGGNQQKVVIARWLDHHAKILFFDEPTRGIDIGAKAEIYQLLRSLAAQGFAIVLISSELPEVIGLSDRVAVFRRGAIVRTLTDSEVTPENVMRHAVAGEY